MRRALLKMIEAAQRQCLRHAGVVVTLYALLPLPPPELPSSALTYAQ
jgi:hypothetical protein